MSAERITLEWGGRPLVVEVGRMAKQADGSAFIQYGETAVLVAATAADRPAPPRDFIPLTVEYREKSYAAGKIPGGFFKREGRPMEHEILTARLTDRSLRPLFPKSFNYEIQVVTTVLSADPENDPDLLSLLGASLALEISDIPFGGPIAAARVGMKDGNYILNPTLPQLETSSLDMVVAGSRDAVLMVEGGARELSEDAVLDGLFFAHKNLEPLIRLQEDLKRKLGLKKRPLPEVGGEAELKKKVEEKAAAKLLEALAVVNKLERRDRIAELLDFLWEEIAPAEEEQELRVRIAQHFNALEKKLVRERIRKEKKRIDGRGLDAIREISCETGLLPRAHGSALFTRGETQAIVASTLGTPREAQIIDAIQDDGTKRFMLHYNFPPYSVGEVRPFRGPGRREIGHGALAERALAPLIPSEKDFPYTIRVVSDILESNGSSSMATVCGGSLSLMDAGVPMGGPVAGIAMGLIKEGEEFLVLSDILGDEDHLGDMDFKIAGTRKGVTAVQMDLKVAGITREVMHQALQQARAGRLHILDVMGKALEKPRSELKPHAPRVTVIQVRAEQIKDVIGPGGKHIKGVIEETGVEIDVDDSGRVSIYSPDLKATQKALKRIKQLIGDVTVGRIYKGKVVKTTAFGAFVEIFPGTDGLVHISHLDTNRVSRVTDVLKEGDDVVVKVLGVDAQGKIRLSRKEALGKEPDPETDD